MADKDVATKLMVGYASVMSTIAAFRSQPALAAEGGTFTLDQETRDLLALIAEANASMMVGMAELIQLIRDMQFNVQGYPPNCDHVVTTRIVCTNANQSYPVPELTIPEGFAINIKAWPLNAVGSIIYVSTSPAPQAQMAWPLIPNEAIPYGIKDASKLWVFTNVAGSQAIVTVEQRS